jgi:phage tail sheath protein FI
MPNNVATFPAAQRLRDLAGVAGGGTEHAIARAPTGVTAFVGRTLKGPVNLPVAIASFADFQQIFGGLWQPSTVSYALEQFFENGGRDALVVRVVNGARPPTLTLRAGGHELKLIGINPGSREYLRASVDYDGIGADEADCFNLVVQRLRTTPSELIEDQEIFRRLSSAAQAARSISEVLLESRLVRVLGAVPSERPERSMHSPHAPVVDYVHSNPDGDDGATLTDYDVIGSALESTGLFALQAAEGFNLLCIPPLDREQDVGLSTLMVAARFCRERHAMLIVDPPAAWSTARAALEALRSWPFRSENAVMHFPRVMAFDRLRGRAETFAACGAVAGMIARLDETCPVWSAAQSAEGILRAGLRPATVVAESERVRLAQAGVNTLLATRAAAIPSVTACTLAAGGGVSPDWRYLSARRLALFINASIERGTRWLAFEQNSAAAWKRAQQQTLAFLEALGLEGAFAGSTPEESYFVICDERVNSRDSIAQGKVKLLFGFALTKPCDFHACLVTHQSSGSRVRAVSANRQATSQRRLEWEIETSILRGIIVGP